MKVGRWAAVSAVSAVVLLGCFDGVNNTTQGPSPDGTAWVVYPDREFFDNAGEPMIQAFAPCGNGVSVWTAWSDGVNVRDIPDGRSIVASCWPSGRLIGSGGYTTRPS